MPLNYLLHGLNKKRYAEVGEKWGGCAKVEGGRWMVEGGWWKVDGGWWKVDGGRWKMEGGRWCEDLGCGIHVRDH